MPFISNAASSSRSGLSASGTSQDCVLQIGGDGSKEVLSIAWSYGASGAPPADTHAPWYGRLVVIIGAVSGLTNANFATGPTADGTPTGLGQYGGRPVLDIDLTVGSGQPSSGQFAFPSDSDEGALTAASGPISIILTGATNALGAAAVGILGKLTVQFKTGYSGGGGNPTDYTFRAISPPPYTR